MASDDRTAPDAGITPGIDADTNAAIDALYQGPLTAFVDDRNRLARALRGSDREASERVRALAKPSLSAWAVNQAFWHARGPFAAMLDAGEALRAQQQQAMRGQSAEGLAAASARLHEAVAPVARAAQEALEQDGHSAAPQLMRRVITTLQAIAAHGRGDTAPPAGRLSADVSAPGFELLTALAPATATATAPRAAGAAAGPRATTRTGADTDLSAALAASLASAHEADAGPAVPDEPRAGTGSRTAQRRDRARPIAARTTIHGARPRRLASRQEAQARHAARTRVANAKAALVARGRALTATERAEQAAAERLDAAAAALAEARAALDRATAAHDRAVQVHQQAQSEADEARAALGAARHELESAENQAGALAHERSADEPDPV